MSEPEFSREVRLDMLGAKPHQLSIEADAAERAALVSRFGLVALDMLAADVALARENGSVALTGQFRARVIQACVASGAPVDAEIDEPIAVLFREPPSDGQPDEDVELDEADLDVMFITGGAIDVGEAVAQSLALALDPFPRSPGAEAALKQAGVKDETEVGPFAALAALRRGSKD